MNIDKCLIIMYIYEDFKKKIWYFMLKNEIKFVEFEYVEF